VGARRAGRSYVSAYPTRSLVNPAELSAPGLPPRRPVCQSPRRGAPGTSRTGVEVTSSTAGQAADAYAVVVFRDDAGEWQAGLLPEALGDDLDGLVAALRQQPAPAGAFALVDVADEFFVVVRVQQSRVRLLLSDVTAAVAWDLAVQVLDALDLDVPGEEDLEDVWPAGDLGIFADLGLDEMQLGAILSDLDAYADEMLAAVARRLGFAEAYERVVDAVVG
jgi:putative tRNA adenosine deaminase-associated protein